MKHKTSLVFALALVFAVGAAHAAEKTTTHTVKKIVHPDGSTAVEETTTTVESNVPAESTESKEDFTAKMHAQLDTLATQISSLKAQASTASSDAKAALEKRAAELDRKRAEINAELDKASNKTGRAWAQFKSGVQKAYTELQIGYTQAKNEFGEKAAADKHDAKAAAKEQKAKK